MLPCINANGIRGFPMVPAADDISRREFFVKTRGQRVGFVDLAPTDEMCELVSRLHKSPHHKPVVYVDHHRSTEYWDQRERVEYIEYELGPGALIRSRREAGSCAQLILPDHWKQFRLDSVAFHHCPDGFLSFLRGSGLSYPELIDDALLLERAKRHKGGSTGRAQLSPIGKLLIRGMEVFPLPRSKTKGRLAKVHQHFQWICDWLKNGASQAAFYDRRKRVDEHYEQVRLDTFSATNTAREVAPKLILTDLRPLDKRNIVVSRSIFRRKILDRFGLVTIATCRKNGHGDVVYIETATPDLDLRKFAPPGITHHCPFRLTVPLSRFQDFVLRWQRTKK